MNKRELAAKRLAFGAPARPLDLTVVTAFGGRASWVYLLGDDAAVILREEPEEGASADSWMIAPARPYLGPTKIMGVDLSTFARVPRQHWRPRLGAAR